MTSVSIAELQPNQDTVTFWSLTKATIDAARIFRKRGLNFTGAMALIGMKAAFPNQLDNQHLLQSDNIKFFDALIWLGIEVNDAVDIIPEARKEAKNQVQKDTIEDIFRGWKRTLRITKNRALESPEKIQLLNSYQREILWCERYSRDLTTPEQAGKNLVTEYREIMNAISLVHNAGALLGAASLGNHLKSIDKKDLSWESLKNKYCWLITGNASNETERRLCALFNIVMGVQVIDDWYDLESDKQLKLNTMASALLRGVQGKEAKKEIIEQCANGYFLKAEEFGVTPLAWQGLKLFFETMKSSQYKFPNTMGGRRERMLAGLQMLQSSH